LEGEVVGVSVANEFEHAVRVRDDVAPLHRMAEGTNKVAEIRLSRSGGTMENSARRLSPAPRNRFSFGFQRSSS
jgi:hypothetical protein